MIKWNIFGLLALLLCVNGVHAKQRDTLSIIHKAQQAFQLEHQFPDSAYRLAHLVLSDAKKINFERGEGYGLMRLSSILKFKGQYDSAMFYVQQAIALRKRANDYNGTAAALTMKGYIYKETGKLDSAFQALLKAIRYDEKANNKELLVSSYLELAHLNIDFGNKKEAKQYYQKSFQLALTTQNLGNLAFSSAGLGKYFFETNSFDSALYYYQKALGHFNRLNYPKDVAATNNNIALCYSAQNIHQKAIQYLQKALKYYAGNEYKEDMALAYFNLGNEFFLLNQPDSAEHQLIRSLHLAKTLGDLHRQAVCHQLLSMVYQSKGQIQKALSAQLRYSGLSDTLLNKEKVSRIAEMQTKYETEKKEQKIALLNQQNKTKVAQRNFWIAGSIVLFLAIFVLGFYLVQRNRLAAKNEQIAQQKMSALLDEQEIKTYNAMLDGQQEERQRIAADLHDRLGSMLSTLKLMFSAIQQKVEAPDNYQKLQNTSHLIDEACVEVRRVSHNLGAGNVANFGLVKAIEELVERINQTGAIKCHFLSFKVNNLNINLEVELYRMVQEAINNALKHANANNLTIQLNKLDTEVNLLIEDDGKGFDLQKVEKGLGLNSLKLRAEKVGGQLHIDSYANKGTTLIIEIPLKDASW